MKFRSPSSVQRKAADILTRLPSYTGVPTRGGRLDLEVLEFFRRDPAIASSAAKALSSVREDDLGGRILATGVEEFEEEVQEGRLLYRRHRIYERSRSLRLSRIKAAMETDEGLACQACRFDFARSYGRLGEGYIQVHHVVPLHESGQVRTRLADLALLCANCHVMAHRARPWPTVAELRGIIEFRSLPEQPMTPLISPRSV
jgi:5-methylcytosine-specific restriction enzyme A